jgi:zinc transport system substrate-binding protein
MIRKKNFFCKINTNIKKKLKFNGVFVSVCLFCLAFSFLLSGSCSKQHRQNGNILIAVSIPPQAWFVSQIAGDKADILILAGPGQNPHNFEPSPRQMQALSSAGAWILSGTEFEIGLLPKITPLFSDLLIVDGTEGVIFRLLEDHEHIHEHSELHNNCLTEIDRHTWLGREPAKILASHIKNTLSALDNKNSDFYKDRYENLVNEIDNVFDELRIILKPLEGRNIFVYHPSFGYFLDEFGIHQEAVETGGKEPTPRQLNNLIAKINEEKASAVFVQSQFPSSAAGSLAKAAGIEVVILDPLAQDWLENIKRMGDALYRMTLE